MNINMLLWDTKKENFIDITLIKENDNFDNLDKIYKLLNCDTIDITTRVINKIEYDIIVDDSGLIKNDYILSYFENDEPQLAGNLLFTKSNKFGENIGLNKKELDNLKEYLILIYYSFDSKKIIRALNNKVVKNV